MSQTLDDTVETLVCMSEFDPGEWAFCASGGATGGVCTCQGKFRYGNDKFWTIAVEAATTTPINCNDATFPGFSSIANRHCEYVITSRWLSAPAYAVAGNWQRYRLRLRDYYPVGMAYSHLVLVSDCDGTSLMSGVSDISFGNLLLTGGGVTAVPRL